MYTQYRFVSEFCKDKDVLEVACETGQGLGYIAKNVKRIIDGDCDGKIVQIASARDVREGGMGSNLSS